MVAAASQARAARLHTLKCVGHFHHRSAVVFDELDLVTGPLGDPLCFFGHEEGLHQTDVVLTAGCPDAMRSRMFSACADVVKIAARAAKAMVDI